MSNPKKSSTIIGPNSSRSKLRFDIVIVPPPMMFRVLITPVWVSKFKFVVVPVIIRWSAPRYCVPVKLEG